MGLLYRNTQTSCVSLALLCAHIAHDTLRRVLSQKVPWSGRLWHFFAQGLVQRGGYLVIDVVWPKSLRIRWWDQKMQNLQQKMPAPAWPEVTALRVDLREAPTREQAEKRRAVLVERYQRELPAGCRCPLEDAEASLTPLAVPQRHQPYVRTSHLVERAFVEERRRTKVIPHLWTEGSVVHLVYGVLIRVSDRGGKQGFREIEQRQIRS